MGERNTPRNVKLFFALLSENEDILKRVEKRLSFDYGPIDSRSPLFPFDMTTYYEKEMGKNLVKRFVSIEPLMKIEELPSVKIQSNRLENLFGREDGSRCINIDPGYVDLSKIVLATTKDYSHRLYLDKKIYAEVTLHYSSKDKSFVPWEWTYPDYREDVAIKYFNELRERYHQQLREGE